MIRSYRYKRRSISSFNFHKICKPNSGGKTIMAEEPSLDIRQDLIRLSDSIRKLLSKIEYTPRPSTNVSIKSILESLLPDNNSEKEIHDEIKDFCLSCAGLASASETSNTSSLLSWIPEQVSIASKEAFRELSKLYFESSIGKESKKIKELGLDLYVVSDEKKLVVELMPQVLISLKQTIKESCIDADEEDGNEIFAASARVPVAYAVVAAHQFRWFVTQVDYPHLGKLCSLVIPCALTVLDHWSPKVKRQGMLSFIHLAKNVNAADLSFYEDVILDTCCQNIASKDKLWHHVVEMSVILVTCIHRKNPRSSWYDKMMNEMLSHLERQPRDKERSTAWLELIEPVFNSMGLVLLAHFSRIFPLFFQWMHIDDDKLILLVLERVHTIIKLTWIRNTPYTRRLVDELIVTHKEASLRTARAEIREHVIRIMDLLQKCKGLDFEAAWDNYKDDPNLATLSSSICKKNIATVVQ